MKKIAVCLSGQIRYWDSTYPLFEHWNNLFKDVEFTFFVSTWNTKDQWYEKDKFGINIVDDVDLRKYGLISKFSKHNPDDVDISTSASVPNTNYMTYLYNEVHRLRNSYEKENNVEFDAVIQTRNDVVIGKLLLARIRQIIYTKPYFMEKSVFSPSGAKLDAGQFGEADFRPASLVNDNDNFYFGRPSVMNYFRKMYNFLINESFFKHTHRLQPEFFYKHNIYQVGFGVHPFLVRYGNTIKQGRPTPESLRKMLKEKGIEWFFETRIEDVSKEYWEYE